jgi:hypothetical protein
MTAPAGPDRSAWRRDLLRLGDERGFYRDLGAEHSVLHVRSGPTLIVTFDNLDHVLEHGGGRLPWGFDFVQSMGWSLLGMMAHGWTWYRDRAVTAFFDDLDAQGFFGDFTRVVFYGASMGGYAAAAFSAAAPGASVIAISPQATLDRARVPWESRYRNAWERDWSGPYGYAPASLAAAGRVFLFHDPYAPLDARHAALFDLPAVTHLRCPLMGHRIASSLQGMGILRQVVVDAVEGRLTGGGFHRARRARRDSPRHYRDLLQHLEGRGRPWLEARLCRLYLARWRGPTIRNRLRAALAERTSMPRPRPATVGGAR